MWQIINSYLSLLDKFVFFLSFFSRHLQSTSSENCEIWFRNLKFGLEISIETKTHKNENWHVGGIFFDFWPTRKFKKGGYNFTSFKTHLNQCHILCVCCLINNLVQHLPSYKSKGTYPCQICPRFLSRSISFYAPIPVNTNATSPHEYVCLGARNCQHNLPTSNIFSQWFFSSLW